MAADQAGGRIKRGPVLFAAAVGLCFALGAGASWADAAEVDRLMAKWLALEAQQSALTNRWREEKPLLKQRQTLLQAEIARLEQKLANTAEGEDQVSQKRAELAAEQSALEQAQVETAQGLKNLETLLESLEPQLPPPVASAWHEEDAEPLTSADTGKRLQVALAKLARLLEFDGRVNVHQMPLAGADGQPVMVRQIYLGAGLAWFATPDGVSAGTGQVVNGQWQWQWRRDLDADAVLKAIASFEKTTEPQRIALPVRLTGE